MKRTILSLIAIVVAMSLTAAPVDQTTAQRKAKSFLTEYYAGKLMAPAALNPVLLKAEMGSAKISQPVYYIYNTSTTFVVVAGDDRAEEILMVGDRPLKDINNLAPGLQDMLLQYKNEIMFLQEHPGLQVDPIVSPQNDPSLRGSDSGGTYLLDCNWDQEAPYWGQCKFTYNNKSYQCLTGCPATSASMVMYFWKYPTAATPQVPAYTMTLNDSYSVNVAALPSVTFDWNNMKNSYSSSYTTAQGNAVATLMRYVGQAEKMAYGTDGSGISVYDAQNVVDMFELFGYDASTTRLVLKTNLNTGATLYSDSQWASMIQTEMNAGRPIVFMAVSSSAGGHAFNVDGYNSSTNKYHCNFGWSGEGNAWCSLNSFGYSSGWYSYNFNQYQQMVIGIQPGSGTTTTPVLTVNPTSLSFTGCSTGETYTKTFTVNGTDLRGDVNISSSNTSFTVSPSTLTAAQAQAGATITVTYKPTYSGTQNGTITVASSGAESKTVSVSGTATTTPKITVNPTSLSMSTTVGTPVTQTFTVTGTNLTGTVYLSCSGTGFSIDKNNITRTAAGQGATVTVTYNPTTAGNHTGTVTLTSSGAETATVQLNGTAAQPACAITVNPTSLTFNNVVGETATKTFTVTGTNLTGRLTLTLNDGGGVYSISPTSFSAAQAQSGATVTVTYAPTTFGTTNASVTISGGGADAVNVALSGTANLTKYAPVMLPANEDYINLTKFRADWTDQTLAENVESYTLEVSAKPVEPEVELLSTVLGTDFTGSSTGYYTITLPAPWGGTNVRGGLNSIIYFRNNYNNDGSYGNITYTIPAGYQNATFTLKITTANTNDGAGNFTVATPQTAAVNRYLSKGQTGAWVVTASAGEKITITTTDAQYSADISKLEVYSGDATMMLTATETGDADYRLITGITDKFYTVENLTAEGTFLYKVKALYIDGTESDWSNIEEVTLFENTPAFQLGDVNHDGDVNIADVTRLIDYLLGSTTDIYLDCADVKADGDINIADVTALIDLLLNNDTTSNTRMVANRPLLLKF
jgi:hypothetical protein